MQLHQDYFLKNHSNYPKYFFKRVSGQIFKCNPSLGENLGFFGSDSLSKQQIKKLSKLSPPGPHLVRARISKTRPDPSPHFPGSFTSLLAPCFFPVQRCQIIIDEILNKQCQKAQRRLKKPKIVLLCWRKSGEVSPTIWELPFKIG